MTINSRRYKIGRQIKESDMLTYRFPDSEGYLSQDLASGH